MSYGVQILNDNGLSIIDGSENLFSLDSIEVVDGDHYRDYALGPGESLFAFATFSKEPTASFPYVNSLQINGGRVTWQGISSPLVQTRTYIVVYKKARV